MWPITVIRQLLLLKTRVKWPNSLPLKTVFLVSSVSFSTSVKLKIVMMASLSPGSTSLSLELVFLMLFFKIVSTSNDLATAALSFTLPALQVSLTMALITPTISSPTFSFFLLSIHPISPPCPLPSFLS